MSISLLKFFLAPLVVDVLLSIIIFIIIYNHVLLNIIIIFTIIYNYRHLFVLGIIIITSCIVMNILFINVVIST